MGLTIADLITCELCAKYSDNKECTSDNTGIRHSFDRYGKDLAKRCIEFRNKQATEYGEIDNKDALKFILAGKSEFILISGKTNRKFEYKLEKKVQEDTEDKFIYWVYTYNTSGILVYAGLLFYDIEDEIFKYGKGARGTLTAYDIEIKSLLYVINSLFKNKTNINVIVKHKGKCGKCSRHLIDSFSISHGLSAVCNNLSKLPVTRWDKLEIEKSSK